MDKKVVLVCSQCKKEYRVIKSRIKSRFCSDICYWESLKSRKHSEEYKKTLGLKKEKHPNWKGGEYSHEGYVMVLSPDHPYSRNDGYIKRSRQVMEKHLGRTLLPSEVVHHISGIRNDDRIENLMLFNNSSSHSLFHQNKRRSNG